MAYPDSNPCSGLVDFTSASAGKAGLRTEGDGLPGPSLRLVPSATSITGGETVRVDVYSQGVNNLRGYQVALQTSGGRVGTLLLEGAAIAESIGDYVFRGQSSYPIVDGQRRRLANALAQGGVASDGSGYLGSFEFRPSAGAKGTFQISFRSKETFLRNAASDAIATSLGAAVNVQVLPSSSSAGPGGAVRNPHGRKLAQLSH